MTDPTPPRDTPHTEPTDSGLGWLAWLLPALLLIGAVLMALSMREREPVAPASTAAGAATKAATEPAAALPAVLTVDLQGGRLHANGRMHDAQARDRLVEALQRVFGVQAVDAGIVADPAVQPAPWLDALIAALPALRVERLHFAFDGAQLQLDTAHLPDEERFRVSRALRNAFSGFETVGLWDRAAAALGRLPDVYDVAELAQALNLMEIRFAPTSAEITADSRETLRTAALAMARLPPGTRIEVGGHTDSQGSAEDNLRLSRARAEAVVQALRGAGVSGDMLVAKGYGQTRPHADNTSEDGRARNRRIEFTVHAPPANAMPGGDVTR